MRGLLGLITRAFVVVAGVGTVVALLASPAVAGGWAVSTLDAVPTPKAGQPTDVGFTVRQHGRTPVDIADVGITVRDNAGKATVFPARHRGATGHYVARVTFPAAGTVTWQIDQGWFGPQDLGTIQVLGPKATPSPAPPAQAHAPVTVRHEPVELPLAVRLLLPAVALVAGGLAVFEYVAGRRRRRALAAA
jgi:hypothetical protein